jgi:hypothetical protein
MLHRAVFATEFTVHVYETHARVALECDDMNEYNQCQTQLKHLYENGIKGCEMEFIAYRLLYYVYLLGNKKYTGGNSDLTHLLSSLTPEAHRYEMNCQCVFLNNDNCLFLCCGADFCLTIVVLLLLCAETLQ